MSNKNSNHRRKNKAPRVYVELDITQFDDIIKKKEDKKYKGKGNNKKGYKHNNNYNKKNNSRDKERK